MKRALVIMGCLIAAIALIGCGTIELPTAAGSATVGAKTGQASGKIILGLFGTVEAGAATAAKNGGITKIATVDVKVEPLLGMAIGNIGGGGLIVTYTTTVTGE
jgi:hypothetical protein